MASLRVGKLPNEVEMNGFLYSILKQMDLKNVDWEQVARDRLITNGHAARMRFSRFKGAQEGHQAKPRKPRAPKDPAAPKGAKAKAAAAAAKKAKAGKGKEKDDKKEPATPPTTPIKQDYESEEMALDNMPIRGMARQRPLPTASASFSFKPDPELEQEQERLPEMRFIKREPDVASETSLESADFGQTIDMLGQVNIDNVFPRPHILYHLPPGHIPRDIRAQRGIMTPEMCTPSPESLKNTPMTGDLVTPIPMRLGLPSRDLFHQHYSNGMPVQMQAFGSNDDAETGRFEEFMDARFGGEMAAEDGERLVKQEERWDDAY